MNLVALFAGAKVQPFFETTKSFFKNFFSVSFFSLAIFAGAKVQPFFQLTKSFSKKFFSLFLNFTPFLKAGAKLQPFFETTKSFFKNIFWSILMNSLPFRKRVQKYNLILKLPNLFLKIFSGLF